MTRTITRLSTASRRGGSVKIRPSEKINFEVTLLKAVEAVALRPLMFESKN